MGHIGGRKFALKGFIECGDDHITGDIASCVPTHTVSHDNQRTGITCIIVAHLGNHESIFLVIACTIDLVTGYIEFNTHVFFLFAV